MMRFRVHMSQLVFVLLALPLWLNAAEKATDGYVQAEDGTKLYYQQWGNGKQVVIIPARFLLGSQFEKLASGRKLIMYDMRDRGQSTPVSDSGKLTIQDDVRDLEAVRRHFKADKFSTVGYSYLGKMVMLYALAYPGRLERAVQIGPIAMQWDTKFPPEEDNRNDNGGVDEAAWNELQKLKKEGYDKTNPQEFCKKEWTVIRVRLVGNQANVSKLGGSQCAYENEWPVNLEPHFQSIFKSIQSTGISKADVAKIKIPVLTIHGTKDRNAPFGSGKQWATELPNARFIRVEGAAHNLWIDAPQIIDWIDQFMNGNWPDRAKDIHASKAQSTS